jgi:hypothetical protein
MTVTHIRTKFAVALGAVVAGAAAPALLFLGAGTAQALPDIGERGTVAIIDHLPTPRECGQCGDSDAQSDSAGYPDPGSRVGISDPEDKVGLGGPDTKLGAIGDVEDLPGPHVTPGQ